MRHRSRFVVTIACAWSLYASSASAQSADTGILGTVADASGAVIPGSEVTITRATTGVAHTVVSDPNGAFEVRYLLPGEYVVQATLSGFRIERTTVTLRVGQMARLSFTLQVGNLG